MQQNKPFKPTLPLYKFLYRIVRVRKKPKNNPLPRTLSDSEWKEIIDACKTVNIEI